MPAASNVQTPNLKTANAQVGATVRVAFFLGKRKSDPPTPTKPQVTLEEWETPLRVAVWKVEPPREADSIPPSS